LTGWTDSLNSGEIIPVVGFVPLGTKAEEAVLSSIPALKNADIAISSDLLCLESKNSSIFKLS
jgi:hypothetical protein